MILGEDGSFEYLGRLNYYQDLPKLYIASKINLAINTSQKTGIDPRVLDVSACGSFILTDYREDQDILFASGEIVDYKDADNLRGKIEYFLNHPEERMEITRVIQKKVLAEHTYRHRMEEVIGKMSQIFNL